MSIRNQFLEQVTANIKMKETRASVQKELDQHIESIARTLEKKGHSNEEAELMAVKQMGSPLKLSKQFNKVYKPKVDWILVLGFACALMIGMIAMYVMTTQTHSYLSWPMNLSWPMKIFGTLLSIFVVYCLFKFNYRLWKKSGKKMGLIFYALGTFGLLLYTIAPYPLAVVINGYKSLRIFSVSVDSSLFIVFYLISWALLLDSPKRKAWKLIVFVGVSSFLFIVVSPIPTIMMYILMLIAMYMYEGRHTWKRTAAIVGLWLGTFFMFISSTWNEYRYARLMSLMPIRNNPGTASSYISIQVKKLLENAKWHPQSLADSHIILPEAHTDFIFVTLTYSLGWIFSGIILLTLGFLLIRVLLMVPHVNDAFGRLLIIGGVSIYGFQLIFNVGMVFGIFPYAGYSLPFVSYGTLPTMLNSIMIGLFLSVYARKNVPLGLKSAQDAPQRCSKSQN
ncbi:FtsW/RodA/SpoVE family cell cycle protein [Bacillus sp. 1P06AnD]|uniref:FtsW/RodA/SpoVE family cell cycle protein n=1 Tax=Bacillus sp. 1P06AnD TaxID=3132208 RepID=UPI0039A23452